MERQQHAGRVLLLLLLLAIGQLGSAVQFKTRQYEVRGDVTIENDTVIINNFNYNGKAPDAFFYVGTSDQPNESGIKIEYPPGSSKTLGAYKNERVSFKLPKGVKGSDLVWISVWCREFKSNLGEAYFKKGGEVR